MARPGGLAVMIGLGKKRPGMGMDEESADEHMADGSESAEDDALSDFFDKGSSGDIPGAKDALKTFIELCYPGIGGSGEESDYEEGETSEEV